MAPVARVCAQTGPALQQRTHGVRFRGGGLGLGLRDDDAFFLAGVRRVATIGLSCRDVVPRSRTSSELLDQEEDVSVQRS